MPLQLRIAEVDPVELWPEQVAARGDVIGKVGSIKKQKRKEGGGVRGTNVMNQIRNRLLVWIGCALVSTKRQLRSYSLSIDPKPVRIGRAGRGHFISCTSRQLVYEWRRVEVEHPHHD